MESCGGVSIPQVVNTKSVASGGGFFRFRDESIDTSLGINDEFLAFDFLSDDKAVDTLRIDSFIIRKRVPFGVFLNLKRCGQKGRRSSSECVGLQFREPAWQVRLSR